MTPDQRAWWKLHLELRLRRTHGVAFQDFFGDIVDRVHGSDYVRVRAFGSLGDDGCDGYLQSSGRVYQCYGKGQDSGLKVKDLLGKVEEDYGKAKTKLASIMKEWTFVHNLHDGVPVQLPVKIEELRAANPEHVFSQAGPPAFWSWIARMARADIEDVLGPAPGLAERTTLDLVEVSQLLEALLVRMDDVPVVDTAPVLVPSDKLERNSIDGVWRFILVQSLPLSRDVRSYIDEQPRPELGPAVAEALSRRYVDLKSQELSPSDILAQLYDDIVGVGSASAKRRIAGQALMAYLFEACDIFEGGLPTATDEGA